MVILFIGGSQQLIDGEQHIWLSATGRLCSSDDSPMSAVSVEAKPVLAFFDCFRRSVITLISRMCSLFEGLLLDFFHEKCRHRR